MSRILKQSTAANVMVFMTDSADHLTGKTGLTLTITASKDGAAFASISPTVTERGSGWYNLALTTSHTDTLGDFALHITASGADPTDLYVVVVAGSLDADITSRLAPAGTLATVTAVTTVNGLAANTITASALAADAVVEIQSGLATAAQIPDDPAEATIKKNTALNNFGFIMYDTDGEPATGKTVTATRSLDGAAFAACANSVTEIANGAYKINLAAGDLNADTVILRFTATGCKDKSFLLLTES